MRTNGVFVAVLSAVLASVSGCGTITRVTHAEYEEEVRQLALPGLPYDEAMRRIAAAGYDCPANPRETPYQSPRAGGLVLLRYCLKASLEFFCPQRRWIEFEYLVAERRVAYLRPPRMEDKSCF